jgi:hypothetical protein
MFSALNNSVSPAVCFQLFKILINPRDTQPKKKQRDESRRVTRFFHKKERIRLATKRQNCVIVVVAGVVCQNGGHGGGVLIQLRTRKNPALSRTPAKYIVCVRHEVYGMCISYEVYGMRMSWRMVCGRKIGLFWFRGLRILSSTWEDCSSNARSIHNNNSNNAAEEVKLGF